MLNTLTKTKTMKTMEILSYFSYTLLYLFLFLLFKLLLQARKFQNLPPGPPSLPIIGNLHHLKRPLHRTFRALSDKYGHVISLWFGSRLVVVVSSQTLFQECFTKNDVVLANRPRFLSGKHIFYNYTTLGSSPYGEHWRNLRRITALDVLSTHRLNSFAVIRRDETHRLVRKLAEAEGSHLSLDQSWAESSLSFAEVELTSKFYDMTFNNIMRMISGKRYYGDDCDMADVEEAKQFRAMVSELLKLAGANNKNDFMPVLRLFDFENLEKRLKKISNKTDTFLRGLLEEIRANKQRANTMVDHLLSLQESQPEYYTDQIIKGLVLGMLIAATDSQAVTLEWALSCVLNHPEVFKRARDELETHVGQDRLLEESDLSKLPYLKNIIYETLRLYTPAPLLLPHSSSEECIIGGFKVPRDTIVLINAWSIHRDPKVWSEATSFKPERFEEEGELDKLIAFGLGRRACPGEGLAMRALCLSLGLLIQCFEWKRVGDKEIDMREESGFTLSRLIPLKAMCKARPVINRLVK